MPLLAVVHLKAYPRGDSPNQTATTGICSCFPSSGAGCHAPPITLFSTVTHLLCAGCWPAGALAASGWSPWVASTSPHPDPRLRDCLLPAQPHEREAVQSQLPLQGKSPHQKPLAPCEAPVAAATANTAAQFHVSVLAVPASCVVSMEHQILARACSAANTVCRTGYATGCSELLSSDSVPAEPNQRLEHLGHQTLASPFQRHLKAAVRLRTGRNANRNAEKLDKGCDQEGCLETGVVNDVAACDCAA